MAERDLMRVRANIGMLFQENALFDSLTVAENVGYRLYEETDMPRKKVRRRIEEVLGFIGLQDYIDRMPSDLSGGQRRRVAIARAMAASPSFCSSTIQRPGSTRSSLPASMTKSSSCGTCSKSPPPGHPSDS